MFKFTRNQRFNNNRPTIPVRPSPTSDLCVTWTGRPSRKVQRCVDMYMYRYEYRWWLVRPIDSLISTHQLVVAQETMVQ